jgi:hypothetical protein
LNKWAESIQTQIYLRKNKFFETKRKIQEIFVCRA